MKNYKLNYTFSRDYDLMKRLLDDGYELVCYADYFVHHMNCEKIYYKDVCRATKITDTHYTVYCRGTGYVDYFADIDSLPFADYMKAANVEFIIPNDIATK